MSILRRNLSFMIIALAALFFIWSLSSSLVHKKEGKKTRLSRAGLVASNEKPFVVIVYGYNNGKYYKKNLDSIFEQDYSNYRVIYVDDGSTDGAGEKVAKWLKQENQLSRTQLMQNQICKRPLENLYHAIHSCKDDELILFLDGNDWLAHHKVLQWLNLSYEDPDVWMTYGSYIEYPTYKRSKDKEIPEKAHEDHSYRDFSEKTFLIPHLRTSYAGLLKKIALEDLLLDGKFFGSSHERALMLPSIEMAKNHATYISDILYVHNRDNEIDRQNVSVKVQKKYRDHIQSLPSYQPIITWKREEPKVDIVLLLKKGPIQTLMTLDSIKNYISNYEKIWVLGEENFSLGEDVFFIERMEEMKQSDSTHMLLCDDGHLFNQPMDAKAFARFTQDTGVERLLLEKVDLENPLDINHQLIAGNPSQKECVALVPKKNFFKTDHANLLQLSLRDSLVHPFQIDLSPEILLTKFKEGLKIDLRAFLQQDGSIADEKLPAFISR